MIEGGADFIAELVLGTRSTDVVVAFGDAHEAALWSEIQPDLQSADPAVIGRWISGNESTKERPGDLGYYLGYRITPSFYERSADKKKAIRDLLELADPEAILRTSGYSPK